MGRAVPRPTIMTILQIKHLLQTKAISQKGLDLIGFLSLLRQATTVVALVVLNTILVLLQQDLNKFTDQVQEQAREYLKAQVNWTADFNTSSTLNTRHISTAMAIFKASIHHICTIIHHQILDKRT